MQNAVQKSSDKNINPYAAWFLDVLEINAKTLKTYSMYFITISFNQKSDHRRRRETEGFLSNTYEFDAFDLLYNKICRKLVGRNYTRRCNHNRLPETIACIDVAGTRYWTSKGAIENKHIHSVWKIRHEDEKEFEELLNAPEFQIDLDLKIGIDGFDIQEIKQGSISDVVNVISYSSKFLKFNEKDCDVEEDLRIYPKGKILL